MKLFICVIHIYDINTIKENEYRNYLFIIEIISSSTNINKKEVEYRNHKFFDKYFHHTRNEFQTYGDYSSLLKNFIITYLLY